MRLTPTLSLALVLLLLTLALNQSQCLFPRPRGRVALADRALEVVAGAKGTLLPAARIGSGPERIGSAIRLGERTLPFGGEGLFAAFVGADSEIRATRAFDLAHAPRAMDELADALTATWPERDIEIVVGPRPDGAAGTTWDRELLVSYSDDGVRHADVADPTVAALLARSWALPSAPITPERYLPEEPVRAVAVAVPHPQRPGQSLPPMLRQ